MVAAEAVHIEEPKPERQHHRHADEEEQPERIGQHEEIARDLLAGAERHPGHRAAALFARSPLSPCVCPHPIGQVPPALGAGGRGGGETRAKARRGPGASRGERLRSAKALRPPPVPTRPEARRPDGRRSGRPDPGRSRPIVSFTSADLRARGSEYRRPAISGKECVELPRSRLRRRSRLLPA